MVEFNKGGMGKIAILQKTKYQFFEKIRNTDKSLVRLVKGKKREGAYKITTDREANQIS